MPREQAPHGLLQRLHAGAEPLEGLLLRIVQPTGQADALRARLAYTRELPARAELCKLLAAVWGVVNAGAPELLPDTTLEQTNSQADVRPQWLEQACCQGTEQATATWRRSWTERCSWRCGTLQLAGACWLLGTGRCA